LVIRCGRYPACCMCCMCCTEAWFCWAFCWATPRFRSLVVDQIGHRL
jgi:hypothetical protein